MRYIRENLTGILAVVGVVAPISLIGILIYKDVEPTALVAGFIGIIMGSYSTIFQYYFGSSSGSKNKQDLIDRMTTPGIDAGVDVKSIWKNSGSTVPFDQWLAEKNNLWKSSGSTMPFDKWLSEKHNLWKSSGSTISFQEWLKAQ